MSLCDVKNISNQKVGEIDLNDALFGVEVQTGILHDVVCMQLANRRQGTASTKTKGDVSGGGAKPWKQKGTGRARSGSSRSPLWRGGGITFGPRPRDYSYKLPKKVRRLALKMALTARNIEGNLVVIDEFNLTEIKTKDFVNVMNRFGFDNCLVVTGEADDVLLKSSKNAVGFKVIPVMGLNVYDVLKYNKLMLVQSAIEHIEKKVQA